MQLFNYVISLQILFIIHIPIIYTIYLVDVK